MKTHPKKLGSFLLAAAAIAFPCALIFLMFWDNWIAFIFNALFFCVVSLLILETLKAFYLFLGIEVGIAGLCAAISPDNCIALIGSFQVVCVCGFFGYSCIKDNQQEAKRQEEEAKRQEAEQKYREDQQRKRELAFRGAEQGNALSQFCAGTWCCEDGNDVEAAEWFFKSAVQENPDAQATLGMMCCLGMGVPKDVITGLALYYVGFGNGGRPYGRYGCHSPTHFEHEAGQEATLSAQKLAREMSRRK